MQTFPLADKVSSQNELLIHRKMLSSLTFTELLSQARRTQSAGPVWMELLFLITSAGFLLSKQDPHGRGFERSMVKGWLALGPCWGSTICRGVFQVISSLWVFGLFDLVSLTGGREAPRPIIMWNIRSRKLLSQQHNENRNGNTAVVFLHETFHFRLSSHGQEQWFFHDCWRAEFPAEPSGWHVFSPY